MRRAAPAHSPAPAARRRPSPLSTAPSRQDRPAPARLPRHTAGSTQVHTGTPMQRTTAASPSARCARSAAATPAGHRSPEHRRTTPAMHGQARSPRARGCGVDTGRRMRARPVRRAAPSPQSPCRTTAKTACRTCLARTRRPAHRQPGRRHANAAPRRSWPDRAARRRLPCSSAGCPAAPRRAGHPARRCVRSQQWEAARRGMSSRLRQPDAAARAAECKRPADGAGRQEQQSCTHRGNPQAWADVRVARMHHRRAGWPAYVSGAHASHPSNRHASACVRDRP
ncbi:hypothetical protein XAB3213_3040004 [Xanthomonas citri pv. bilvae]|nr:hypothetical protein XAB3213_3040004 [Xanthomonas citri pv. bilvae]